MLFVLFEVWLLLWVFFFVIYGFFWNFCNVWDDLNVEKLLRWVLEIIKQRTIILVVFNLYYLFGHVLILIIWIFVT